MKVTVQNKVNEFRNKKGVTQEELAEAVDVTRQTIISIEKGNYVPSVLLALKISDYFNESVNNIFKIEINEK